MDEQQERSAEQDVETERRAMDALVEASFVIAGIVSRTAAANDLSLTQLRVLAILRDRRPRMADLAGHLGLDRSTVSGLIDRAALRGLVERAPSPEDGRSTLVGLTDAGRRTADRLADETAVSVARLTGRLPAPDLATLLALLTALLDRDERRPPR